MTRASSRGGLRGKDKQQSERGVQASKSDLVNDERGQTQPATKRAAHRTTAKRSRPPHVR